MAKVESALHQNCINVGMNNGWKGGSGEWEEGSDQAVVMWHHQSHIAKQCH